MKSRGLPWMLAAVVLCLASAYGLRVSAPVEAQQAPSFRATSDLVAVDVSVRQDGRAVTGLTVDDFAVTDNGVRQRVESLEASSMPLDVTVLVDVSAGTSGVWTNEFSAAQTTALVNDHVRAIAALLRPDDRLDLITSNTYVREAVPIQQAATARVGAIETSGLASTYDALVSAMLRPVQANRRHLVIAWLKPLDEISAVEADLVRDVARRTDAVVHIVARQESTAVQSAESRARAGRWRPFHRVDTTLLADVPSITGGTLQEPGLFQDRSVSDTFKGIFEVFRQGHVIRYQPQGVRRDGWHEISVTVPRFLQAEVRARRGYLIGPPAGRGAASNTPASAAMASPPNGAPVLLPPLMDALDAGQESLRTSLRQVRYADFPRIVLEYRHSESPWPASPQTSAIFALQLAAATFGLGPAGIRGDVMDTLLYYHDLVRHPIQPDRFECAWYEGEVTALSAYLQTGPAYKAVTHALTRCPSSGALLLARAIVADQFWSTDSGRLYSSSALRDEVKRAADVLSQYDKAMVDPAVAAEAGVRSAWLAYRTGDLTGAAARLDRTPVVSDRVLRYFLYLVRGQVLREQLNLSEAADAYRSALAVWPRAQSGRVALMTVLMRLGERREAEALAEQIQADPDPPVDPWWLYWQGRYYAWPSLLASLAEMTR